MERPLSGFFNADLAQRAGLIQILPPPAPASGDPLITGLEYDSRRIKPGNIYFALPGLHADGRDFIPDAVWGGGRGGDPPG
jgi:UDP-N-acetylmuramyl tripeptide synthase